MRTHPQGVANLYEFVSSAEHKGRCFEERLEPNSLAPLISIVEKKNTMKVNGANRSSKYLSHTGLQTLEGE